MAHAEQVDIDTFLSVAEMIAIQLRLKEADRWTVNICQIKFVSFLQEFPEVTGPQLIWAAEKWIQSTGEREFLRYPTWQELMAPLYRCENGLANRDWGFKEELPPLVAPAEWQGNMLPPKTQQAKMLPMPEKEGPGLTKARWAEYLQGIADGT